MANSTLTFEEVFDIFISSARQMDTVMFQSIIGATVHAHCEKFGVDKKDFYHELAEVSSMVDMLDSMEG